MSILLKGGIVVSSQESKRLDVRIDGEVIVEIGKDLIHGDSKVIDISPYYLMPGFIDGHTHLELNNGPGTPNVIDGYASGTYAAIAGGTTTILDMATPSKGQSLMDCYEHWNDEAMNQSYCDYSYHMAIIDWNETIKREVSSMMEHGITSFKMYMAYRNLMSDDHILYEALSVIHQAGGLLVVHCENEELIRERIHELEKQGALAISYYPKSRPSVVEAEAVNRMLAIAELVQAPIGIVHVSSPRTIEHISNARENGQEVYVETCPQYLILDDSVYEDEKTAYQYVCAPPIRSLAEKSAMLRALKRGMIDTISTDQCAFSQMLKSSALDDFRKTPGGLPGIEHRAELIFTIGVRAGLITIEEMVSLLSEKIAKIFHLYPRKGSIEVGSDADLVVWDPEEERVIRAADQWMKVEYNPYEGMHTYGKAKYVFLRGKLVSRDGVPEGEASGVLLRRKPRTAKSRGL